MSACSQLVSAAPGWAIQINYCKFNINPSSRWDTRNCLPCLGSSDPHPDLITPIYKMFVCKLPDKVTDLDIPLAWALYPVQKKKKKINRKGGKQRFS